MEHKFRAYDKETEEFVYSDNYGEDAWFEFTPDGLKAFALHGMDAGTIDEPPQAICDELEDPELFTGRQVNGVDLYAGDILGNVNRHEVKWHDAGFQVVSDGHITPLNSFLFQHDVEIIGNIHD